MSGIVTMEIHIVYKMNSWLHLQHIIQTKNSHIEYGLEEDPGERKKTIDW